MLYISLYIVCIIYSFPVCRLGNKLRESVQGLDLIEKLIHSILEQEEGGVLSE